MSFGGHVLDMISRNKLNRSFSKKKKYFKKGDEISNFFFDKKLVLKKASKEEVNAVKEKLNRLIRKKKVNFIVSIIVTIVIIGVITIAYLNKQI